MVDKYFKLKQYSLEKQHQIGSAFTALTAEVNNGISIARNSSKQFPQERIQSDRILQIRLDFLDWLITIVDFESFAEDLHFYQQNTQASENKKIFFDFLQENGLTITENGSLYTTNATELKPDSRLVKTSLVRQFLSTLSAENFNDMQL